MINIIIDGDLINTEKNKTLIEAALENGKYIPHLCFQPGLGSSRLLNPAEQVYLGEKIIHGDSEAGYQGCGLCLVEIEGTNGLCHACTLPLKDGMKVHLNTDSVKEQRSLNLEKFLVKHPHACISCDFSDGCERKMCSMDMPEAERCCWKYHHCEFREVASFIGFKKDLKYKTPDDHPMDETPLMVMNHNLCIGCLRCVVACRDIAERAVFSFINNKKEIITGLTGPGFKEAGCKFCLACVDVCPTGALREKDTDKKKTKIRRNILETVLPPTNDGIMALNQSSLAGVPNSPGVYKLHNEKHHIVQITGSEDLKKSLQDEDVKKSSEVFFSYEQDEMFMMKETHLIQKFMKKHGDMPENNQELDDLF